jgi:hypothetical protein
VHTRGAVEAPVLLEHRLDLNGDQSVLGRPLSRRLLPLPAQPGNGVLIHKLIDQAVEFVAHLTVEQT